MIDHDIVDRLMSHIAQACVCIITVPSEEPWSLDTPVFFIVVYLVTYGGCRATFYIMTKLLTCVGDEATLIRMDIFWWGTCRVGENFVFLYFHDVSGEGASHSGPAPTVAQAKIEPIQYVSVWNITTWYNVSVLTNDSASKPLLYVPAPIYPPRAP